MDFRILGPLEVWDAGEPLELGAGKQRTLLAVLLLDAGSTVSTDRLIEALWDDAPPASAVNSVHVYVSQLRKVLSARVITRPHGYAIEVAPAELDVHRFEQRITEGRERLAHGDAEGAATVLAEGLGLWRGPPLAEFSYDAFAQGEIRRLEELRLTAREELIDAELERGRHAQLVPELEALLVQHPRRERLRGQLMLALYRSGRQAEALEVYTAGREALLDELGLEPGPALKERETAILRQDPALELTRKVRATDPGQPRSRAPLLLVAGGAVLLVAIGAAALALTGGENGAELTAVAANSVAVIDPETDRVVADIPVGVTPSSITAAAGGVWALNADDRTLSRIAPGRLRVNKTVAAEREPMDVAAGAGAVWVGSGAEAANSEFVGTLVPVAVARLDPESGVVAARLPLPRSRSEPGALARRGPGEHQIAVGTDDVWAIDGKGSLSRFDPRTNRVTDTARGLSARSLATDRGGLWVGTADNAVLRVPSGSTRVAQRIELETFSLGGIAAGAGAVWVTDPTAGTLWRIDPGPSVVTRTIPVGAGAFAVAFGEGAVWVVNTLDSTVLRIDPASNRVVARIPIGGTPREIAVGHGRVWVTVAVGGDSDGEEPVSGAPREGGADRLARVALRPGVVRRRRRAPVPDRLEPAPAQWPTGLDAADGPGGRVRAGAPRFSGGAPHDRLPVVRRLDQPGIRGGSGKVHRQRAGTCVRAQGDRRDRPLWLRVRQRDDSDSQPRAGRAAGARVAVELVSGVDPGGERGRAGLAGSSSIQPVSATTRASTRLTISSRPHWRCSRGISMQDRCSSWRTRPAARTHPSSRRTSSWPPRRSTCRSQAGRRGTQTRRATDGLVARIARARPGAVFLSGIAFDNGGPLVRQLREGLGKDVATSGSGRLRRRVVPPA